MCWDPQTLQAPRRSGCRGARTILPKSTEVSPLSLSDHTQMVFTCSYLTLKRFSKSIILSLAGKIRRLLEQSTAPLKVENKPFPEPKPPRSSFSTQRSSHYVVEPLPASARWPLGAHSRCSRENGIWEKDVCSKSTKNREPRRGRGNLLTHLRSYFSGRTF